MFIIFIVIVINVIISGFLAEFLRSSLPSRSLPPFVNRSSRIKNTSYFFFRAIRGRSREERRRRRHVPSFHEFGHASSFTILSISCSRSFFFIWKAIAIHPATYYPLARKPLPSNHPFSPPSLPFSSLLPLFSPSRITLFYLYLSSTHRNCKL